MLLSAILKRPDIDDENDGNFDAPTVAINKDEEFVYSKPHKGRVKLNE